MQLLSSLLLVSALVTGFVDAKRAAHEHVARHGGATKTSDSDDSCGLGQFFWPNRSLCLTHGGPKEIPKPPSGLDCPDLWYFHHDQGCCVPRTKPKKPTTPTCSKNGFSWIPGLQCCSKGKPPTPPHPHPSGVPKSKKGDKKGWHGEGFKDKKGWHGEGFKDKKDWSGAHDHSKIKRNFEQWDTSYCPTGLTACPSVSYDVFTGDTECIDILSDLYSCGGCTSKEEGKDCSKIPNASCLGGVCVV